MKHLRRIAHGEFREQASTHGRQFWVIGGLSMTRSDDTQCEVVLWDLAGQPDYRRVLGKDRPNGADADTASPDFAAWRAWITSIVSIVAGLWSKMRREREIRRITASWETIDDRTLKDIGICRHEIEYGRAARHWS